MLSKLGMYESSHLLHTWIYDLYTPGGDASQGGSDKVSKPPTRWVLNGNLDGNLYCQVTWTFIPPNHMVWLFLNWHSTWGQEWVKQNWEIVLFPDSFYFWSWCFPLLCLKLPNKQPLPNEIVGAQCPAAKHRRSSASVLLGAVMSVVRRGTSLTCMVQG